MTGRCLNTSKKHQDIYPFIPFFLQFSPIKIIQHTGFPVIFPFNQGQKRFTGAGCRERVCLSACGEQDIVGMRYWRGVQSSEDMWGWGFQYVSSWFYERYMFRVYLIYLYSINYWYCVNMCHSVDTWSKGLKHSFRWWDLAHSFVTFLLTVWKLAVSGAGRKTCEHCRVTCVVATCSKEDENGPLWPFSVVVSIKTCNRLRPTLW